MNREIQTFMLDKLKPGPGGHWFSYGASYVDDPTGLKGYGQTEREARFDLQKQTPSA